MKLLGRGGYLLGPLIDEVPPAEMEFVESVAEPEHLPSGSDCN